MKFKHLPVLAVVGRPNVGKSTLFNRLIGARKAIVDDLPGVTRDRNYGEAEWTGTRFLLVDTGGFAPDSRAGLNHQIQEQSRLAIEEADVILFLFDGKAGLNPLDREAVEMLREVQKPVFFAVNKLDTRPKENLLYEFYALGLNEIFPLSAEHGLGLSELMDRVVGSFPPLRDGAGEEGEQARKPLRLAIIGRPNVGKSTLVNRLLGYERSVVHHLPGTTRDAVDSPLAWKGEQYILVDTAGVRRKARIADRVERYSAIRALTSLDRGDLVIHLIDGPEGPTDQDAQLLSYALQRGKGLILAVNKWDLLKGSDSQSYREALCQQLSFVSFAPLIFVSALSGYGIEALMESVKEVAQSYQSWIKTSTLNQAMRKLFQRHAPPSNRGRGLKFYYATQTSIRPPTFTLFVNSPKNVEASYERYLSHQLRLSLGLEHAPMRLIFRARRDERGKEKGRTRRRK